MEETPNRTGNSGMSGLKVVFFFPLLPEEDIIKVVVEFFFFKRTGEAGKIGFQPKRKKPGEKFGVVFSFAVVVTDTELYGKPDASYGRKDTSLLVRSPEPVERTARAGGDFCWNICPKPSPRRAESLAEGWSEYTQYTIHSRSYYIKLRY